MSQSQGQLFEAVDAICRDPHFRRMILRHCPMLDVSAVEPRFSARIHAGDQMLNHSLLQHQHAAAALSQYFNIARQQYSAAQQLIRSCFGAADASVSVLDFACGYGRLLRFLSLALPRSQLWASELQGEALAFVEQEFGVRTLASNADPALFEPGRKFDVIWVASLFSHLPEHLFHGWLGKLSSLLTARGVLCFSVRDSALLAAGRALPDSGILYETCSENAELGADIYGTAYASEAFVRAALQAVGIGSAACVRLPKALAHEQDLYVAAADPLRDLSALGRFRRGPWGWVDRRRLGETGRLDLQGWAASLDDGRVERVEIVIDGIRHQCATDVSRPDVQEVFGDPRMRDAGWQFSAELGRDCTEVAVEISAHTAHGESCLLFGGTIRPQD